MAGTSNPTDAWLSGEGEPSSFYPQDQPPSSVPPGGGFQELIDRAHHATAVCDRELRYLAVNWRWKKDFGLENRNLVGQKHGDLFPYLGTVWEGAVHSVLLGHPEESPRDQWVLPSNRPAWVRWHLEPWSSKRGKVGGFTITCEILGPEAQEVLAQIGQSLLHSSSNPLVRTDLQGRILESNAAARAWAIPASSMEAQPFFWDSFCLEEHREAVRLHFLQGAQESLVQKRFCIEPAWSPSLFLAFSEGNQATWTAHPLLDARSQIVGVLWFGLPIPQSAPPKQPYAPPLTGSSLAQMLEFAPFGLVLLDRDGRTVFANQEHASLLGFDLRSHASMDDWLRSACPHGQDPETLVQAWKQSVVQEEATCSFTLRSSDHRLCNIRFHPRRTADGGLLLGLSDVTSFQQKLELLEDADGPFRSLFWHAQAGIALEDATSGKIVHANPALAALTHQSLDQLRLQSFIDLIHREDQPAIQARIAEIRQDPSAEAPSMDVRLVPGLQDGAPFQDVANAFVRLTLCGIPSARGDLLHLAYFLTDVAIERLKPGTLDLDTPAALDSFERQCLAFEQAEDAILITDRAGRIVDWNSAASQLFGYSRQAILGKSFSILFAPEQPQPFHQAVAAAFSEAGTWAATQTFFRQDGSKGVCQVRYVAKPATSGQSTFIIGFHRAIAGLNPESTTAETQDQKTRFRNIDRR